MDTVEQSLAQSTDRNISVIANAGSGKTTVLVKRYLNLLLSDIHARNIYAITFTKKAASEMIVKVAKEIDKKYNESNDNPRLQTKLKYIREQLTNAQVSTIHSFCASIIRDNPIEANINPAFTELTNSERIRIFQNSYQLCLENWLDDKESGYNEKAKRLFYSIGKRELEELVNFIFYKTDLMQNTISLYDTININNINTCFINDFISYIFPEFMRLLNATTLLFNDANIDVLTKAKRNIFLEIIPLFNNINSKIHNISDSNNISSITDFFIDFKHFYNSLFTTTDTLRKAFEPAFSQVHIENIHKLKFKIKNFDSFLNSLLNENYIEQHIELSKILLEFVLNIIDTINSEKKYYSAIDFDDLLTKTQELLSIDTVANKLRNKIKYLLVDEFQDTNIIQYDIITKIVPELLNKSNENKTNLFIVGDAKQSIYSFRNADVEVFHKAIQDIKIYNQCLLNNNLLNKSFVTPNGNIIPDTDNELLGDLKLTVTFRLQPVVASFVNYICSNIMQKNNKYEVEYSDFIVARNIDDLFNSENSDFILNEKHGSITFLISKKCSDIIEANETSEDDVNESENEEETVLIAKYLIQLVDTDKSTVKWSDIAILSRKKNNLSKLTDTLINYNIPFILHSGAGFYQSTVIKDLLAFLLFLSNQNDDISLAITLKSPFFNISDTLLLFIKKYKNNVSLWQAIKQYSESPEINNKDIKLIRIFTVLSYLITQFNQLNISSLIDTILVETGYLGLISNQPDKLQLSANIAKLKQIALDFENHGFKSINDFITELQFQSKNSSEESEAAVLTSDNAVNIMTIHASKGLEFPVVILYNTNSKNNDNEKFFISKEYGYLYKWSINSKENNANITINTPIYEIEKIKKSLSNIAEEKRILYVAMTRAKDKLIISSSIKINKDGNFSTYSHFKFIYESLNTKFNIDNDISQLELSNKLTLISNNVKKEINISYPIQIITSIDSTKTLSVIEQEEHTKELVLDNINSSIKNEIFSASKLTSFKNSKEEYLKKYLLGLPPDNDINFSDGVHKISNTEEEVIGTLTGSIIHSVLENINLWLKEPKLIDKPLFNLVLDNALSNSNRIISDSIKERIIRECYNIINTKLIGKYYSYIKSSKTEYDLYLPISDNFLIGKFDLLLTNSDSNYEIWDWKTNKIDSYNSFSKIVNYYELQMKIYAYLISLMNPEQNIFTARLLFTRLAAPDIEDDKWTWCYSWSKEELINFGYDLQKDTESIFNFSFF